MGAARILLEMLLPLDLENMLKMSVSVHWFDGFKLYLVYMCIMKGCWFFNFYFLFFKGEGFHTSSISSELLKRISMNLGRNEVLMIPCKCCCISK
jgi:hypothetical protein